MRKFFLLIGPAAAVLLHRESQRAFRHGRVLRRDSLATHAGAADVGGDRAAHSGLRPDQPDQGRMHPPGLSEDRLARRARWKARVHLQSRRRSNDHETPPESRPDQRRRLRVLCL